MTAISYTPHRFTLEDGSQVLVSEYLHVEDKGTVSHRRYTLATRAEASHTWGPPVEEDNVTREEEA